MKKKILLITALVFVVLLVFYNIYNRLILNFYSSRDFKVDFDNSWVAVEKSKNYLALRNKNNSTIQIASRDIVDNKSNDEDIYYDFEEEFRNNNPAFELINYSSTKIGRKYLDGYTYMYEYKGFQILLILIKHDDKMIQVTYSVISQYFDFELEDFYNILNSLEIN